MNTLLQDVRYAFRTLARNPALTAIAVLTLALGIGANTAIFSVVNAVLLRPLPYKDPQRLVMLWTNNLREKNDRNFLSPGDFTDYRDHNTVFSEFADVSPQWTFTLTGAGDAENIPGFWASADLFPMLGVAPALGRAFTPDEDRPGAPAVALLGYALWQRRFSADPNVLGKAVNLDGASYTIVGVLPADFRWLDPADVWVPLSRLPLMNNPRNVRFLLSAARLAPGVTLDQAQSQMSALAGSLEEQFQDTNKGIGVNLIPLTEQFVGKIRRALLVLLGAVAFVLLIACANVANLLLARAASRQREMAVRAALGAGRARLLRQLLTESVLLAMLSGIAGILLALWGVDVLLTLAPADLPRRHEIGVNGFVLFFTLLTATLAGILCGLAPAWSVFRSNLHESLKEGARSLGDGRSRHRLRRLLVVGEIAVSLLLLVGAGLLLNSFVRLQNVDPGFHTESVLALQLSFNGAKYQPDPPRREFMREFYARIAAVPGVLSAGEVSRLPLLPASNPTVALEVESRPLALSDLPQVDIRRASANYFRILGIPVVEGRTFDERDTPQSDLVAVVNQTAARRFFAGRTPVGTRVHMGIHSDTPWYTVIGVVGNIHHLGLSVPPRPELYISSFQGPLYSPVVVVRTTAGSAALVSAIRSVVAALDPGVPVSNVATLDQVRYRSVAGPRFQTMLLGIFAGLALLLAIVGIYGVMAYSVTQRTHEIGVRMALGARRRDILASVLGSGFRLALAGIAIGTLASFLLTRYLAALLFEVRAADPLTFAAAAALLAGVALLACYIPARRATKVDPMVALRYE